MKYIHFCTRKSSVFFLLTGFFSLILPLILQAKENRNPAGFEIQRGVNLSHWLSQDFGWFSRENFITPNDLKYIASLGYDHVRLPIDEKELWKEDGSINEDAFALMKDAIEWAISNDLRVILDLHTVRSHHFNAVNEGLTNTLWSDPAAQENFLSLWDDLTAYLKNFPNKWLAYEIMNEPVAEDPEDWNRLIASAIGRIRENEPNRVIVVGSNKWQIPQTLPLLKVPEGDKNIILSTHTYMPFLFTHYTANWTPFRDFKGEVQYPGPTISKAEFDELMKIDNSSVKDLAGTALDDWGPERMAAELQPAIAHAKKLGLQLYCGEFGCLATVDPEQRSQYYRDIISVFEANGMAWANWEYKGDFGIFEWFSEDPSYGAPNFNMIDALLGNRE